MGTVYFAEHQLLRRPCAVKFIRPEKAGDERTLERFEREVHAAAGLTHPNSIQIFDYGRSEDGTFYYVMEYLPGLALDELVELDGPLSPVRAVRVLTQLCGALREAHAHGLVHRDLKPANVMLCERGGINDVVKLLDYGIVSAPKEEEMDPRLTQAGAIIGTPAFMSPEQCGGDAEVTPRSDVYGIGALAFYLLVGQPPFGRRSTTHTLAAHLYEVPRSVRTVRADVPEALSHVISRCLEKNPDARYPDMNALTLALLSSISAAEWAGGPSLEWWFPPTGETSTQLPS